MDNVIFHNSETPAHGKQVFTSCAFIHRNQNGVEKLFLPKRADTKKFLPGKFELPGGHIDYGEDLVDGLKREIQEEFKMSISIGDVFHVFTYLNDIKGSHSIEAIYFATFINSISEIKINPEDHSIFIWFSQDEYIEMMNKENKENDQEYGAILKGFNLLKGTSLNFG